MPRTPTKRSKRTETPPIVIPKDNALADNIDYDLRVLFVGINPGLMSAARGHHFAGPTNHFWPCLSGSGLVDKPLTYLDDNDLPRLYRLGITNLTSRTSRKASDLTLTEQRAGIPALTCKIRQYRPRIACFVGKGIYEIYTGQKCPKMGLQSKTIPWGNSKGLTRIFVMPSTSGIVSAYQKDDKLRFFKELCKIAKEEDEKTKGAAEEDLTPVREHDRDLPLYSLPPHRTLSGPAEIEHVVSEPRITGATDAEK
ncbi:uracil-DNA glycosylase-like protein [Dichotomocladium elegans]|nr:uracil-DNA glycosylase-like protein [Dichotomocladium elegans]